MITCKANRKVTKTEVKDMAESIKAHGLLQRILIQKDEVVAGRTRWQALTSLGVDPIEGEHYRIIADDADPDVIAFIENDQRHQLSIWEEVEQVKKLCKKFTMTEVGENIGRSPRQVQQLVQLSNLCKKAKTLLKDNESAFTITQFEEIAKFPQTSQEQFLASNHYESKISTKALKERLDKYAHHLKDLPWNEPGCKKCDACLEHLNGGFLFSDLAKDRICLDMGHIDRQWEDYFLQCDYVLLNCTYGTCTEFPQALSPSKYYEDEDEPEQGIFVNGWRRGEVINFARRENGGPINEGPLKKTLKELKVTKHKQRQRWAIEQIIEHLGNTPKRPEDWISLLNFTGLPCKFTYEVVEESELLDRVYAHAISKITRDLNQGQKSPADPQWKLAEKVCELYNYNLKNAFDQAVEKFPDPKSWEKMT